MEALERRIFVVAAVVFIIFSTQCGSAWGYRNSTRMSYVCPPNFIRLGHSCYFFSDVKATWQKALFSCKDRDSNLSVPARWEDRNLRNYLNKPGVEKASRWIGGIYDYNDKAWKWGGELRSMHYQSFSKMRRLSPEELQWHCIAMMPELKYRWSPASCYEARQFICQTRLRKLPKSKVKDLKRRWQRMGVPNEITVPSVSGEVNNPKLNDVTLNPILHPKSYDLRPSPMRLHPNSRSPRPHRLRPNELRKRSRPTHRRLTKPFPGYQWNRRDPDASYRYNANLLKSGKTGLTPQQVKSNLARLQHLRDKQLERRRKLRERGDWLVNDEPPRLKTHARTYTMDNNISALHPKTIVEEFDMLLPPPPPVPMTRQTRGTFLRYH